MRILHIVINPFTHDSRVLKSAKTACLAADAVCVFSMHEAGLSERERLERIEVVRFPLKTKPWPKLILIQLIKYFELFLKMRREGIKWRPTIVHAHDLNALPIGRAIAKKTGAKLIYDSHELWIGRENHDSYIWPIRKLMDTTELLLARKCDEVITVSPGIARILESRFRRENVNVVRNVPERWNKPRQEQLRLRRVLGISPEARIILYQGNMAADGRIECLLNAFAKIKDKNAVLVFMGNGQMAKMLQNDTIGQDYHGRVRYQPAISPADLPYYTSDADIGIVPIPDICLSYRLSLPNKFFEFMQGRLSIVASDLPEMRCIVNQYDIGVTYEVGNAAALAERLDALLQSPSLMAAYRENANKAAEVLNWQNEQRILLQLYNSDGR